MIDIGIRPRRLALPTVRIRCEILHYVFIHFFLKIHPDGAINANDFIRADAGVRRHITARVGNSNVRGNVANGVVCAIHGSEDELLQEGLVDGCVLRRNLLPFASKRCSDDKDWSKQGATESLKHASELVAAGGGHPASSFSPTEL